MGAKGEPESRRGKGFECFMAFSTGPDLYCCPGRGCGQGAPRDGLETHQKRKVFGKPLSESELVQVKLAEMANMD